MENEDSVLTEKSLIDSVNQVSMTLTLTLGFCSSLTVNLECQGIFLSNDNGQ